MDTPIPLSQIKLFDLFTASVADQAICLLDDKGVVRLWNTGAENFYRYSQADIIGQSASKLLGNSSLYQLLQQAFAEGEFEIETDLCRKDGSVIPAHLKLTAIYDEDDLHGYAFNAHSLAYTKKAEYKFKTDAAQELPGSDLFKQLVEHSYSGISLLDNEFNFIYRSPSAARITGFNDVGRNSTTFNDIVHPSDRTHVRKILEEVRERPGFSMGCKLRSRHFDGHFIVLEGVFTNWLHQPGINAIVLNFHDITERELSEKSLKQTIAELSAYKNALDLGAIVAITDQKGVIRHVNQNFCKISGYSMDELIGQDHRIVNSGYHPKSSFASFGAPSLQVKFGKENCVTEKKMAARIGLQQPLYHF